MLGRGSSRVSLAIRAATATTNATHTIRHINTKAYTHHTRTEKNVAYTCSSRPHVWCVSHSRLFSTVGSSGSDPSNAASTSASKDAPPPAIAPEAAVATTTPAPPQTWREKGAVLWAKAKAEGRHYWLGTKLLWADIKIARRLLKQIAQGHEMTRRERKQLLRTSADLVRMVPFVVILIVPFAEFALPFLLKFFPNMLPSTYLDSTGAEAKLQKQLLVKMEMARFLQETTHLLAQQLVTKKGLSTVEANIQAQKFRDFMEKVRTGKKVHNSDIVGFSKLFDSELTLENLTKDQLAAMCRLLDIKVFGSVWVLRYKLQERLRQIQKDDLLIQKEGVDSLSENELRVACRERGIYTGPEKDVTYLKRKLLDWLELSLQHQVPVTLLFLSRAFSRQMTGTSSPSTADASGDASQDELSSDLATTLAYVPHVVVAEAEKEIVGLTDDAAAKLKHIEEEAVEAAYEELQARKEGKADSQSRATKILQMKTAIGVTQEKLEKLTETNVTVGTMIDNVHAEKAKAAAEEAAVQPITAAATVVPVVPSLDTTKPIPTPAAGETAAAVTPVAPVIPAVSVKESSSKAKTINAVDKLNDKVGAILEEIKAHTKQLEALEKQKAELEASLKQAQKPKEQ